MVEPLDGDAAADVALRLVLQRGAQVLGRDVALGLVVELEDVAVRVGEAVRGAVPDVAVDPALAEPGRLDRRDRAARAPRGLQARRAMCAEPGAAATR